MKPLRQLIPVILLCFQYTLSAQVVSVKCIDSSDGSGIPFVTVQIKHSGAIFFSDTTGNVNIKYNKEVTADSITFFHVGYRPLVYSVDSLLLIEKGEVRMTVISRNLPEFVFEDTRPLTFLKEVIQKVSSGISRRSYIDSSFYRQCHWEDGKAVFLAEAGVEVFYSSDKQKQERVKVNFLRRSVSLEQNGEQHADHLIDILTENPAYHPLGTILNKAGVISFDLHMESADSGITKLEFIDNSSSKMFSTSGYLLIRTEDRALLRYVIHIVQKVHPDFSDLKPSGRYLWLKQEERIEAEFNWINDSILPSLLHQRYTHYLMNPLFHTVDHDLTEDFLWVASGKIKYSTYANKEFDFTSGLYSRRYKYDDKYFEESLLLRRFPADMHFIHELELNTPIEEQFRSAGL